MRGWGCGIGLAHPRRRPALTRSRLLLGVLVCYHRGTRTDEFRAQLSPSLTYKYTRRTRPHTRTRIRVVHAHARKLQVGARAHARTPHGIYGQTFPFQSGKHLSSGGVRVPACPRVHARARNSRTQSCSMLNPKSAAPPTTMPPPPPRNLNAPPHIQYGQFPCYINSPVSERARAVGEKETVPVRFA